ncbi:3'(2'),5'-bisphosphate nucleotidase CysQ family protein [Mangrovibrevibacter kandeliae]|uniref:3'(2'),5'-bisphosphate nucleotidase CysQ family protein n=1 Tax=Mangrovibrevibacter kandeliae TaxID=2968473 RepID=UPI0021186428|nr:inositol monophosphatase family protein [Aurantimonas sp. CSK15Z-1]MCQ8782846.1 3'(2'),5'-bisphosphate nucleotidase CysQ [Aurantimonas sp. CSK15Z-1]
MMPPADRGATAGGPELDDLVAIALRGGARILSHGVPRGGEVKADGSPVTAADRICQASILSDLAAIAHGLPVVAEEEIAGATPVAPASDCILVDPLDGTREFLAGDPDYTVNVAVVRGGWPVAGVVYAPALAMLWAAHAEQGAVKMEIGDDGAILRRLPVRSRLRPERPVALASRSHLCAETAAWLHRENCGEVRYRGSSLKICLVAEGAADLYPRLGPTRQWDTAAADAVLRAAGGAVLTLDGVPLAYGAASPRPDFVNPPFVAYGDPAAAGR